MTWAQFKEAAYHQRLQMGGEAAVHPGHPRYEEFLLDRLDETGIIGRFKYGFSERTIALGTQFFDLREIVPDEAAWVRVVEVDKVFIGGQQIGEGGSRASSIEALARGGGATWQDEEGTPETWYHVPPHHLGLHPKAAAETEVKLLGHLIPNRPAQDAAVLELPTEHEALAVRFAALRWGSLEGAEGAGELLAMAMVQLEGVASEARAATNLPTVRGEGRRTAYL